MPTTQKELYSFKDKLDASAGRLATWTSRMYSSVLGKQTTPSPGHRVKFFMTCPTQRACLSELKQPFLNVKSLFSKGRKGKQQQRGLQGCCA
jgi:hypothetical protein